MTAATLQLPKLPDLPSWAWAAIGLGAAWLLLRPRDTAKAAAETVVNLAGGLVEGLVKGTGAVLGIPNTDADRCAAAVMASNADPWSLGKALDVSLYCPAGTFLKDALGDLVPSAGARGATATPTTYTYPGGNNRAPVPAPKYDPKKPDASVLDILWGPSFEKQSGCVLPGVTCSYGDGFDLGGWITDKNSQNRTITPIAGIRG